MRERIVQVMRAKVTGAIECNTCLREGKEEEERGERSEGGEGGAGDFAQLLVADIRSK